MLKRLPALALATLALCLVLTGCLSTKENPEVWKTDFTGVWELGDNVSNGAAMSADQLAAMKADGMNCFFVLNETGTCRMNLCGAAFNRGTWTATAPNKARLSFVAITAQEEEEAAAQAEAERAAAGEDETDATDEEEEDGVEVSATYDFILSFRDDQLHLTVDSEDALVFDRTTHVAMSEYLDGTSTIRETRDAQPLATSGLGAFGKLLERLRF